MRQLTIAAVLFAGAILTLGIAACGGGYQDTGGAQAQSTRTPAPTAKATATTSAASGGETSIDVRAADFSFDPATFKVAAAENATISLNNTGAAPHTLTVYRDEEFTEPIEGADTGTVSAGSQGDFTASFQAGEYFFRCEIHPTRMQGEFEAE
jgi:plastocyanin